MQIPSSVKAKTLLNQNWPEASWSLCGVFDSDAQLFLLHNYFTKKHGLQPFARVHGSPLCQWSGARIPPPTESVAKTAQMLKGYAERGMPVTLNLTGANAGVRLDDSLGRFLLGALATYNHGQNAVCVCDETLADYIRQQFPTLKLCAAVAKADQEQGQGSLDYYRRQETRYDLVQIHPDDNLNPELLAQLENRGKYEIVVNDPCIRRCPDRKAHHQADSDHYFNFLDGRPTKLGLELMIRNGCEDFDRTLLDPERRPLILNTAELKGIYDLGFRQFRIDDGGRANDVSRLVAALHWLLSDDVEHDHLPARMLVDLLSSEWQVRLV